MGAAASRADDERERAAAQVQAVQRGRSVRTQLAREKSLNKITAFLNEPEELSPRRKRRALWRSCWPRRGAAAADGGDAGGRRRRVFV